MSKANPIDNYERLSEDQIRETLDELSQQARETGEPVDFGAIEKAEKRQHPQHPERDKHDPTLGGRGGRLTMLEAIEQASRTWVDPPEPE